MALHFDFNSTLGSYTSRWTRDLRLCNYLMGVELRELDVVDVLLVARLAEERLLVVHLREDPVRRRRGRSEHLSVVGILEFAKENFKFWKHGWIYKTSSKGFSNILSTSHVLDSSVLSEKHFL